MTYLQANLTEEEMNVIETVKYMNKFKTKQETIKFIIKLYGEQHK